MTKEEVQAIGSSYATVLKRIMAGESILYHIGKSWEEAYCDNVNFECDGWRFTIFNDCDCIDYTDHLTTPEGQHFTFDDLWANCADPISYTQFDIDTDKLEEAFKRTIKKGIIYFIPLTVPRELLQCLHA